MPHFLTSQPAEVMLDTLSEVLDLVDFGIVLLDRNMRVQLINRRCTEIFVVPRELLAAAPSYLDLLRHTASLSCYAVPPDELRAYIARREASVRAGAEAAEIDLRDGRRLSFRCIARSDGGRILTYADITRVKLEEDLQREARDAAERAEVELRFNKEILEDQASYLASLAEDSDANARRAEAAKQQLVREIAERRQLEVELRRLATTDALTGTLNRRQLFTLGERELARARERAQGLGVVMVDIDHFKVVNDQYGHPVGDEALKHVVGRLRAGVRRVDLIGRLGGEEFAVVLPRIAAKDALQVAERLRAGVAAKPLVHGTARISMTISIGLSMARDTDRTIEQTLGRADVQLYQAKGSGRNRVCHADLAVPA